MIKTSAEFLAKACGGRIAGAKGLSVSDVKIDSRECLEGDMFVAVVGEVNNGHRFLAGAYENGARVFLVSEETSAKELIKVHDDACCIIAGDTNKAFSEMALAYIKQWKPIKIGITGSTGKTSTKALTKAVMSAKYNTVCSRRNYNTHLGICMTCFLAGPETEAIVFEMGMDRIDELFEYTSWVRPETVMITNVGVVHMENIGSPEGVAVEKLKITSHLEENQPLIYNCDSPFLNAKDIRRLAKGSFPLIAAGEGPEAEVRLSNIIDKGLEGIEFDINNHHFILPFAGAHNAHNAALAAACGLHYGISLEEAAKALPGAEMEKKRMDVCKGRGITLIDASYNANPDSMASAVKTLARSEGKRRIAVISDMRELGFASDDSHLSIGKLCADEGIDMLIAIGDNRALYVMGSRMGRGSVTAMSFADTKEAIENVPGLLKEGDTVLVKGSLSTEVYKLADKIKETLVT